MTLFAMIMFFFFVFSGSRHPINFRGVGSFSLDSSLGVVIFNFRLLTTYYYHTTYEIERGAPAAPQQIKTPKHKKQARLLETHHELYARLAIAYHCHQ
jgi:hypothetical protein